MEESIVFLCSEDVNGLYSAVYEAWTHPFPHHRKEIEILGSKESRLFVQYKEVLSQDLYAEKVARSLERKLGPEVSAFVYHASLSNSPDRGNIIFHFLTEAFSHRQDILTRLQNPWVMALFKLDRMVSRESHSLLGFVRFQETPQGLLYSTISPLHRQLPLIAPHFSDRFPRENFCIHDLTHHQILIHPADSPWFLAEEDTFPILPDSTAFPQSPDPYPFLWDTFFQSISIRERTNLQAQNHLIRNRFRSHMTEFQE